MYLGNGKHLISISNKEVELSESEIIEIIEYAKSLKKNIDKQLYESLFPKQKYHKNKKIKKLFKKYYTASKTKKEVFQQIALELQITYKAVEKAYYIK